MNNRALLISTIFLYLGFLVAGIFDILHLLIVKLIIGAYMIGLTIAIVVKLLEDYKKTKAA